MKYKIAVEFMPRKNFQGVNVRIEKELELSSDLEAAVEVRKMAPIVEEEAKKALNGMMYNT
jgi:hypothetical protein